MSGYLSRLVGGAMRGSKSIHPMVGSVYSPFRPGDYDVDGGRHEEGLSGPSASMSPLEVQFSPRLIPSTENDGPEPSSQEGPLQLLTPQSNRSGPEFSAPGEPVAAFELTSTPPVVVKEISSEGQQRAQATDLPPLLPAPRLGNFSRSTSWAPIGSMSPVPSTRPLAEEYEMTTQPLYRPMIPWNGPALGLIAPDKRGGMIEAFPPVSRGRKTSSRDSTGSVTKGSDEIQIHIGRIEVTALPPAPTRAAAQTPRKGLNLEEYLKRSDRRTR